jgi:hypothetical protein
MSKVTVSPTSATPAITTSEDLMRHARVAAVAIKSLATARNAITKAYRSSLSVRFGGGTAGARSAADDAIAKAVDALDGWAESAERALAILDDAPRAGLSATDAAAIGVVPGLNGPRLAGLMRASIVGTSSGRSVIDALTG